MEDIDQLRVLVADVLEAMERRKVDLRIADKKGWKVVERYCRGVTVLVHLCV